VSCVLEFARTESVVRCNAGFGPITTQNHLQTKQFVSGTRNYSRVGAYALRNEKAG
jgi:hypothetical protein